MNDNDYVEYIKKLIPTTFEKIYAIDMMADLVIEYGFENDNFIVKNTTPFTNFYNELEQVVHPDDIKTYIDNISINNSKDVENNSTHIRYEYRQKMADGKYSWYSNIVQPLTVNQKKVAIVLVSNINENIEVKSNNKPELEKNMDVIINSVSNAIVKLHNVMNINYASDNPEMKSMTKYVNNILFDLTSTFPELNDAMAANIISNANQGTTKTILIVDDDQVTCKILAKTFEDTYEIVIANNGQEAIDILEKNQDVNTLTEKDRIVGMFLDLNMPVIDGFGVLDYMNSKNLLQRMPVIIISGDYDQETKDRAYLYPIADVLEKPFNIQVIKHRIQNFIKLYKSNNSLNEIVLTQHQEIKNILKTVVKSYFYDYAYDIKRISSYTTILARQLTKDYAEYHLDENRINKLTEASKYYHVGLYVLPHKMFKKQNFNEGELKIIRSHSAIGLSLFNSVLYRNIDEEYNQITKDIIRYHDAKYDGTGYPSGLKGDNIPIEAQIVSVAIEYNELLKVMNESSILDEIVKSSGTKFNPKIVNSLKNCIEEIKKVSK